MTEQVQTTKTNLIVAASISLGLAGAVAGGAMAAAKGINDIRKNKITREEAATHILKESAGTGLAAGVSTAVLGISGISSLLLGTLAFTGTAVASKYLWDNLVLPDQKDSGMTPVSSPAASDIPGEQAGEAQKTDDIKMSEATSKSTSHETASAETEAAKAPSDGKAKDNAEAGKNNVK